MVEGDAEPAASNEPPIAPVTTEGTTQGDLETDNKCDAREYTTDPETPPERTPECARAHAAQRIREPGPSHGRVVPNFLTHRERSSGRSARIMLNPTSKSKNKRPAVSLTEKGPKTGRKGPVSTAQPRKAKTTGASSAMAATNPTPNIPG